MRQPKNKIQIKNKNSLYIDEVGFNGRILVENNGREATWDTDMTVPRSGLWRKKTTLMKTR